LVGQQLPSQQVVWPHEPGQQAPFGGQQLPPGGQQPFGQPGSLQPGSTGT